MSKKQQHVKEAKTEPEQVNLQAEIDPIDSSKKRQQKTFNQKIRIATSSVQLHFLHKNKQKKINQSNDKLHPPSKIENNNRIVLTHT